MRAKLTLAGIAAALVVAGGVCRGHYPMLEAEAAVVRAGEEVTIELGVGHPFVNDRFDREAPVRARVFPPRGRHRDLTAAVTSAGTPDVRSWRVKHRLRREGDYVFAFDLGLYREPPARQIEDYAKVIVHVEGSQVGWSRVVGDPLEIVPLTRPYGIPVGATFRGQVLENGAGMIGGVVEAETYATREIDPEEFPELMTYRRAERTDAGGSFSITLDQAGWWLLSVATDGGPGEQGGLNFPAKRAVLWVFVGPWEESYRRAFAPAAEATEQQGAPPVLPRDGAGAGVALLLLAAALGLRWSLPEVSRRRKSSQSA